MEKRQIISYCFGCWRFVAVSFAIFVHLVPEAVNASDWGFSHENDTIGQDFQSNPMSSPGSETRATSLDGNGLLKSALESLNGSTFSSSVSRNSSFVSQFASAKPAEKGLKVTAAAVASPTEVAFAEKNSFVPEGDLGQAEAHGTKQKTLVASVESTKNNSTAASVSLNDNASHASSMEGTLGHNQRQINNKNNESPACLGCTMGINNEDWPQQPLLAANKEEDLGAKITVTSLAWAAGEAFVSGLKGTKKLVEGTPPALESQEDAGSGDIIGKTTANPGTGLGLGAKVWNRVALERFTSTPIPYRSTTESKPIRGTEISPDSAEKDHILEVLADNDLTSTLTQDGISQSTTIRTLASTEISFQFSNDEEHIMGLLLGQSTSSSSPAQGVQGNTDFTFLGLDMQLSPQPVTTASTDIQTVQDTPLDQTLSGILDIDYYDTLDSEVKEDFKDSEDISMASSDPYKKGLYGEPTSQIIPDSYDDFTTFDNSDFYPTQSVYTYDDDFDDDDYDDDDDDDDDRDYITTDLEDENELRLTTVLPTTQTIVQNQKSTTRSFMWNSVTPENPAPKSDSETSKDGTLLMPSYNNTDCKTGYVRHNNTCKSVCDMYPSYCYNGGQCYMVANAGVFCRCNTQDYIWHKGMRCEFIVTEFQVMCIAIGSSALVVLLLFMITVFFAKKLHLLKTENNKLRKRKYRTPSEQHNDNFSLSTIAEGSHPNDDPNAQNNKAQDAVKPSPKQEHSFNIQSSLTPKHDNNKVEENSEVNLLQNNLM
ncbi:uncharacterized protein LOC102347488 isoform X2 [Latimeria chalumnae]|uniref:uncharacterized protein LOC102347488 isoform X2 n=1 Tax=Latimeria chalumnae TaxID=7897 RepID=UPI00313F18A0